MEQFKQGQGFNFKFKKVTPDLNLFHKSSDRLRACFKNKQYPNTYFRKIHRTKSEGLQKPFKLAMKKVSPCSKLNPSEKVPSQLIKDQESGKSIIEQFPKPKITQYLNIGDHSIYPDAQVSVDEPLFQPVPHVIQFTNYEPLQIKEQILKLRNKDKVARSVKIVAPDSKLFQIAPCKKVKPAKAGSGGAADLDVMSSRVAPGMEVSYVVRFSPEAKIDYSYDLTVVTEREKFIVPIRAVGCRALLDFPDTLDFGPVPVKHTSEKPVMIRNIGEKTTKWHLKIPAGFKVNKHEGILEVGQSEQIVFDFTPQEARGYRDQLVLLYDKYDCTIPILGEGHNDNVYLSKQHIHMEPTSISLFSHQYYKIVNKSTVPVEFSWRAFATEAEEFEKKARLNMQLSQEEAEERAALEENNTTHEDSNMESLNSDDSYDEDELRLKQERTQQKAVSTLARKYQSIKKAVDDDPMLFQDEIFSIEPLQGKIWPNTEITCCVTFRPQGPYHYSCTAFCNVTCSEDRLALNMTGQGRGPQAQLSITEMDIGDIFVNYQNEFDVGIENTGEIDCHWKLVPYETPFGSKFHFSKSEGILGVKEKSRDLIRVTFKSDILGEFSETFRIAMEGSAEMLSLTFKGHVVAPTFKFSEEIIDFGRVSYKFPVHKTVHLTNTSDVEINYVVRVPGDGRSSMQNEFNITNDRGRLEKNREAQITIEFVPCFPQQYDMVLVVDLEGVGQDMLAVPIKAECLVPKVRVLPTDFLEYDQCFLRHPKTRRIEIINDDALKAKYEIVAQDDQSKRIAVYQADQESGVINPKSSQVVNITLKTEILSSIRIPLYIKVEGYHIPFMVTILATSIGPIVSVNKTELEYGNVDVLKDYIERLTIKNESKIPAEYTAFTKNKESVWKVIQRHGVLNPDEEKELEVVCNADEVQKFQDTLHIIVNNGVDLEVALRAKGIGSTLFCKDNLNVIDFGTEYTFSNITKEFFLENRGRKQMKIQWVRNMKMERKAAPDNKKVDPAASKDGPAAPNNGKKSNEDLKKTGNDKASNAGGAEGASNAGGAAAEKEKEEEVKVVYTIVPDQIVLNPKMGIMIQVRANSTAIGKIVENWLCNVTSGGERKPKVAYNASIQGDFITPQLNFSEAKLFFKYLWEKGVPSMPISKTLDITNSGPLSTSMNLLIDPPFSCATEKLTLQPGQGDNVLIKFDPGMKQDRLSDNIAGKLTISHVGHPQKDIVALQGEVCFPNLNIQPPNIDFGCILNDTSKKKYLTLTNISEMPVNYEWSFLEEEMMSPLMAEDESAQKGKKKSGKKSKLLPINEVFDILPVSGMLKPGQTETVEFTFYSGHGLLYNGVAVCSVDGGPDYEVPIVGESSFVSYKLSTTELDYGEIPYNESSAKEFFIENIGKVPFQFNINLSTVSRPGLVECHPMTGKVAAGEKYKVIAKFFPGIPANIDEMFLVECAHFPAQRFKVKAVGTYPGCLLSFPRSDDEDFHKRFDECKKALQRGKSDYAALFHSGEALKQMAPLPKAIEKDKSLSKEPFVMEVEAEVDRRFLCDKILQQIEAATQKQMYQTSPQFGGAIQQLSAAGAPEPVQKTPKGTAPAAKKPIPSKTQTAGFEGKDGEKPMSGATLSIGGTLVPLDNINIATYQCDFGNVVVGATKKKSFRFTNTGRLPVNFAFDKKLLGNYGIAIEPDKVQKLPPNSSVLFNVVYVTRKNAKFGKVKNVVPIDIKYGPSYAIEFVANLTIPELVMSSDQLDFGKVCVNTRKTIKVRFENHKEVPCDWNYFYKPDVAASKEGKEAGERFQVFPLSGTLLPGQKQTVDIMFTPNVDKLISQKINFKCKDNPKVFVLNVKGQGVNFQVDFVPDTLKLGPVLPYSTAAIAFFEMRNPMEIPVEIYSLDFDKQYIEEEEILKRLDQFIPPPPPQNPPATPAQAPPPIEPMYLSLRVPGAPFWPSLRQQDEKKQKTEELKKKLKQTEDDLAALAKSEADKEKTPLPEGHAEKKASLTEQKVQLEAKIAEQDTEPAEVKMPPAVKDKDRLNLVLIGPEKAGKTSVANYLSQEHQRCIVKLDQLYDYCVKRQLPVGEKAMKYLELRQEELTKALEEQEKAKKAKGKKPPPKGQEEPEVNPNDYKYLTKELIIEMIQSRVKEEDCNAGVIFDNLEAPQWPNLKIVLEAICEALPTQNVQVLLFNFIKDQQAEPTQTQPVDGAAQEEAKEELKPKDFTKEEQEAFAKFAEDINNFFAEILLRQMNQEEEPTEQQEKSIVADAEESKDQPPKQATEGEGSMAAEGGEAQPATETQASTKLVFGKRILVDLPISSTIKKICEQAKKVVPEPVWPDPDKEPLPPPVTHSIVRPPPNRKERAPVTLFSIWTPKEYVEEPAPDNLPEMQNTQTRWILQPKEVKNIYIKFFSKNIGSFDQVLQFEIVGAYKPINLNLNAICEFPTINSNYKNVFMAQKKSRPPQAPESYLSKCYVVSENVFDFGPLLIGKDPEKRHSDELVKKVNSSVFQITNNGKYDLQATFTLKSSLPQEEGGISEKSPFLIEPETMDLKIDETKHLTVYSFPDHAKPFKDEVICLLKDNPNPVIFNVQCLGAKPVVEVDQDVVEFDRLLLEKKLTKVLTLKNVCSIPIKWKLTGVEGLPEEFQVSKNNGTIKPCKEELVEITFTAKKEQKFNPKLTLEVEDTEGYNIKQEPKVIELKAEAFKISLDIKFSHEQILDFEAVRVGEPKENKLVLKNIGMYSVKYSFTMKKKQTREIFTVDPMEGDLAPGEEKSITVKFQSSKELKLKTTKNESDIILNIFEGKSQEKHTQIPINVNVNAVFSKYSITPLKNINFGPMTYGEQVTRTFEIRNEGLFEFKYALCDYKDDEAKKKIKEERQREMEERIKGSEEKKEEVKDPKKKPEPAKAPPKKPDPKGGAQPPPEGGQLEVSQYTISPATGAIPPGSAAVVNVVFKAKGSQFYESTIAIDVANRDPTDNAEGIPFELCAESSIPGINTEDLDQIFEEQTVIPSLDPSLNTQTIITSSIFATQERLFWFGTLIAGKTTEGKERFKIMNPNKVSCTVKFSVKPRSQSKSEGFAFDVKPDVLTIEPHKHKYVTVGFYPVNMMTYGGIFEAIVDNGDPTSKQGKLVFELRGEGTLPTLQVEKPKEQEADGTPALKFRKTRIGKDTIMQIVLKNEGSIAATARFDVIKNDCFSFLGNLTHTITPKSYHAFDISFAPKASQVEKFLLTFNTQHNPYEQHKVLLIGEGYSENVTFEGLPEGLEDELQIGDCIVGKSKSQTFQLVNNGDKTVKFRWNQGDKDEFKFHPGIGHIAAKSSKQIKVVFKSGKTVKYDKIDLLCETCVVEQKPDPETGAKFRDWDDTMKTVRMVRPSEYKRIMKQREDEERKRKEEAEAAALAAASKGKAPAKAPAKPAAKEEAKVEEIPIDMSEEPSVELIDTIPEPENTKVDGSDKNVPLKTTLLCDHVKYDCQTKNIDFKPTLMYASRSYKFAVKNTSLITMNYNWKIVNSENGVLDAGPYTVIPKKGHIAPGCDDTFIVKFSPTEVETDFSRILSANIENLSPEMKPLIIEVNGVAERPIVHFELPPSSYKERKEKDMVAIDNKYKIIEFDSLGTNIKNTKRFMAVNPTSQGYEFEWEEIPDEHKKLKPMFKCITPKGVILSGKKFEMIFEYIPDNVGEHESYWLFKVPSEKIVQHFMVVGRVVEPNVLFETGKIKFGPLLLEGKNREVVNIINQEQIPFSFNFSKESVKGSTEYGESLRVNPMAGVVPPQSQIPIEILFFPKYELTYNYNLICNVKRKARPLVLNVKGEGYKIHHSVFADVSRVPVTSTDAFKFDYGDFFINEKKTKLVTVTNNGEFNFDFVWKRQVNKYITITPETGTIQKGTEATFEITYLPIAEHQLKNYKVSLSIVSGPKYDFLLNGNARKPGVKLSFQNYDFGPCFVMRQPMPKKAILEIVNYDNSAISVEIPNFEKKPYLDVQLAPGQVLLPSTKENPIKLEVPIIFTPRVIKKYTETVKFDFNGLHTIDVTVTGEGIPMQLELVDPDQAVVDFGIVSVGGDITKTVALVNKSKQPVTFSLLPSNAEQFKKCCLALMPDKEVTLKPRETVNIEVRYAPKQRMPNFDLDILLAIKDNESRSLLQVQGVSHGIEMKLMDAVIAFGSVVKNSRLTKILQLSNFGDVKAAYKWDSKVYSKYFTITPESGYVNPNSTLDLEVTFHPTIADSDIRYNQVKCEIKGGDPLFVTLMGKSVEQDPSTTQTLNFQTVVRKATKQVVAIQNTEDKEWVINPTISTASDSCSGYFSGKQTLVVPPKQTAQYEIHYAPKTMTKKNASDQYETHVGSLFFPLPNGTALLYNLNGVAIEPEPEALPQETVQAKKARFIIIPVRNWLKTDQRFKVSWVVEGDKDQTTFVKGANMLDLAGESSKDFKLNFLAYKTGTYKVKLTFLNEASGEYLPFILAVTATDADLLEIIELASPIRESIARVVTIENPTEQEVVLARSQFTCASEYIEIAPEQLKIPPRSERGFEISYRPLIVSDQEVDLILKNPILGDFKYKLQLKGLPATSQRSLAFRCALGADLVQAFKFTHFLKKPTAYSVKIERLDQPGQICDFKSDVPTVQAAAADSAKGVEIMVNVKYEPFTIGETRAILKLASPEGMEYTCLLLGKATAPLPQGPVKCPPGAKPAGIDFKNPLNEKCEFVVTFDNPNFSLASKLPGPIDPGKMVNLQIKYDAKPDLPTTGRMIVQTKGLPPWIYYLQGE